jgi:secondary thiamine-phosphate synthase enzyme
MILQKEIRLEGHKRGFHLITENILRNLDNLPEQGILTILLKHTSAAIIINENADPSVRTDFNKFMIKLIPEETSYFIHTLEGADDMPAHIKSSILGQSLTIPITNHKLNMGTWQGIYLCEFRNYGGPRELVLTIFY